MFEVTIAISLTTAFVLGLVKLASLIQKEIKKTSAIARAIRENEIIEVNSEEIFEELLEKSEKKKLYSRIPLFSKMLKYVSKSPFGKWAYPLFFIMLASSYPLYILSPFDVVWGWVEFSWVFILTLVATNAVFKYFYEKQQEILDNDITVFLDSLSRGVRVGKPFEAILLDMGDELTKPMRKIVKQITDNIAVGLNPADIFKKEAVEKEVDGFFFVSATLNASAESGGSIGPAIDNLSNIIKSNRELKLKVKSLAAQSKFSAYVLSALPFVGLQIMGGAADNTLFYTTLPGNLIYMISILLIVTAFSTIQKMANIKV